jgi:hypothetical protein
MKGSIESILFTRDSKPYGHTFPEWTIKWWRWLLSLPIAINPATDNSGQYSSLNQNDPNVWFLAGTFGGSVIRTCTIPLGKSILMPIINYECSFADEPSINTDKDLQLKCMSEIDDIKHLTIVIDDLLINDLTRYRVKSPIFSIELQENNILGINSCRTQMITDGFWIFLKPLKAGSHKVSSLGSCRSGRIRIETTYNLRIA